MATPSDVEIHLRPLQAEDWADWRRLWTAYLDFYRTSVADEVYTTTWARLLSGAPGEFSGRIARRRTDDRALGLVHFVFHRHCWSVGDVVYLQDLYVDADARGAGVGRALIEAVYAEADAAGAANVYWMTQTDNATARRLYDAIAKPTDFMKYSRR